MSVQSEQRQTRRKGGRQRNGKKNHPQFSTAASAGSQLLGDDETPAKTRNAGLERAELSCADSAERIYPEHTKLAAAVFENAD